jgi:two-component system sensor histidine kinase KdpD
MSDAQPDRFVLPRIRGGALSRRRVVLGFVVALVAGPLLTWVLYSFRTPESITSEVLAFQLLVVIVSLIGGIWPALFAAVLSGLTLDFLFVAPQFTVAISDPLHLWALFLYIVIAILVSYIVDQAARRARTARRATAEAELLASVAGNVLRGQSAVPALVTRTREAFGRAGVRLVDAEGRVLATDGEPVRDGTFTAVPVGDKDAPRAVLEIHGAPLDPSERRLLEVIVAQLGAALERTDLSETAREAGALAEMDQVRTALLSAVSHDLRRPLAAAVAAIGGLRGAGENLSEADRRELLETADESLATLSTLVTDLLDVSRVQAGVLAVSFEELDAADVVLGAVEELGLGPAEVDLALDPDLPPLRGDSVLLQRVLVNVLANAVHHAPAGSRVGVETTATRDRVQLRVIDHGAGVPADHRGDMFTPFQRLGDVDNTTGLGLGLALSKGFMEGMGGTLVPEDTRGGGLTMVISLPRARAEAIR